MVAKMNVRQSRELVKAAFETDKKQARYAMMRALNKTASHARSDVQTVMPQVFDRPTAWVINSLRIKYAEREKLRAEIAFKDKSLAENSKTMVFPHVEGGDRAFKSMETRLWRMKYIPKGWFVIPGNDAPRDANGNMSRGEISRILNVLGTYTEAGYNKANYKTVARLRKGSKKKNQYGFEYFVVKLGDKQRGKRLKPGVYKRYYTGFGSSLKCMMRFVPRVFYRKKPLDFYGIIEKSVDSYFESYFTEEFDRAMVTAR